MQRVVFHEIERRWKLDAPEGSGFGRIQGLAEARAPFAAGVDGFDLVRLLGIGHGHAVHIDPFERHGLAGRDDHVLAQVEIVLIQLKMDANIQLVLLVLQ